MSYHRVLPRPIPLSDEDLAHRWAAGRGSVRTARNMTSEGSHTAYLRNSQVPASSTPEPPSRKASGSAVEQHETSSNKAEETVTEIGPLDSASSREGRSAASNVDLWQSDTPSQICLCQPDPKVPRPRNAFILYRQHHQASIVAQNPGLPNPEISKVIGDHWRASTPEVKEHWKQLAEEEKIRHQRQYPDYRYQPRRSGRAGSLADSSTPGNLASGEAHRCAKCGGKAISSSNVMNTNSSVTTQGSPGLSHFGGRDDSQSMPPPPATSNPTTGRFPRGAVSPPVKDASLHDYRFARPQTAHALPQSSPRHPKRPPEDVASPSSPDSKRRRLPTVSFPHVRGPQGPQTPFPLSAPTQRRPSLPRPDFMGSSLPSPSVMSLPTRLTNGQAYQNHDAFKLAPLHTPSATFTHARSGSHENQQLQTLEAMIHSIPLLNKIRVLGKISGPLPPNPSPTSPTGFERRKGRGPVIAIDSADSIALKQIADALERNMTADYDLKIFTTPRPSQGQPQTMQAYLRLVEKYHDLSRDVMAHVCPPAIVTSKAESDSPDVSRRLSTVGRQLSTVDLTSAEDKGPDAMDVSSESPVSPKSLLKTQAASELSTNEGTSEEAMDKTELEHGGKKLPVALLPAWQLTHTDFFATNVPITDSYSPMDHWQWHATAWRGIVGADATVAVESTLAEDAQGSPLHTAISSASGSGTVASTTDATKAAPRGSTGSRFDKKTGGGIDIRLEDSRAVILQAGEKGSVGEGSLRRVGFEIGEWVRGWTDRENV